MYINLYFIISLITMPASPRYVVNFYEAFVLCGDLNMCVLWLLSYGGAALVMQRVKLVDEPYRASDSRATSYFVSTVHVFCGSECVLWFVNRELRK